MFSSCLQFDSSEKSLLNNYEITWVDDPQNRNISHKSNGKVIGLHVFQVGYNDDYIIAKQHPVERNKTDKRITNFFILEMEKKGVKQKVYGPLTKHRFEDVVDSLRITDIEFSIKYEVDRNRRIN